MLNFVYGGCHSGKSTWTLRQVSSMPNSSKVYIAAMEPSAQYAESIARQRRERASMGFTAALEAQQDIAGAVQYVPPGSAVILECLCHLTANELFTDGAVSDPQETFRRIAHGIELLSAGRDLFVVSNEIAADGNVYDSNTELYKQTLSELGRFCAARADNVYEVVCGLAVKIK